MAGRDTGTSGVGTAVGDPVAVDASADETARAQETAPPLPTIAKVPPGAPLDWLRRGWDDLRATRFVGLFYGAVFVAMGYAVVTVYATRWQLTSGLIGGFFLMGPFICAGLYELSRQRARGERGNLLASMLCWRRRPRSIALFAFVLTFAMLVWTRVSVVLFALFSNTDLPTLEGVLATIFSFGNLTFVLIWTGAGLLFASLVFAIGVVSVPMLLDRDCDALTAVFTSVRTLAVNPKALYLWAVLVVLLIGASLALALVPLLVTAPLVGHATWHAYTDLVGAVEDAADAPAASASAATA